MFRLRTLLLGASLVFLLPGPTRASEKHIPLKIRFEPSGWVDPSATEIAGDLVFESAAKREVEVAWMEVRARDGVADATPLPARAKAGPGASLRVPLRAGSAEGSLLVDVRVEVDGKLHERTLDLSPSRVAAAQRGGRMVPEPGAAAKMAHPPRWPEPKDPTRSNARHHHEHRHAEGGDDPEDRVADGLAKARNIRVTGYLRYIPDDGIGWPTALSGARVEIWDEDTGSDEKLTTGYADSDGYFDITFTWDPCFLCDARPDLYVEAVALGPGGRVDVQTAGLEWTYAWSSWVVDDYEGSYIDFYKLTGEGNHAAAHIYRLTNSAYDILLDQGYDLDNVDVQWPEPGEGAFYIRFFEEIHIASDREWNEGTILHELGHHWHYEYAAPGDHDYCNSTCDSGDCGHCMWCEEDRWSTVKESMAHFFAYALQPEVEAATGWDFLRGRSEESVQACIDAQGDPCACDPLNTEGFLFAFLQDLADSNNENDGFDSNWSDEIELGKWAVMSVMDFHNPVSATQWFEKVRDHQPVDVEALWRTAKNAGYDFDVSPPDTFSDLHSLSHAPNVPSPASLLKMAWTRPSDDASGVAGYSVEISGSPLTRPDTTLELGPFQQLYISETLAPGTYYFTILPVDRSGKAALTHSAYGPVVVREPQLSNLRLEANATFPLPVFPRDSQTPASIPSSPLPSGTSPSWWAMQFRNDGESPIGDTTVQTLSIDGQPTDSLTLSGASPGQLTGFAALGPIEVRGGRHTVGVFLDSNEAVQETNEMDNGWAAQWTYEAETLPGGGSSPVLLSPPPSPFAGWSDVPNGFPLYYNSLGLRWSTTGVWCALAGAALEDEDDYDLRLYDPATDAVNGFINPLAGSATSAGKLDFLFVNRNLSSRSSWDVGLNAILAPHESLARVQTFQSVYVGESTNRSETLPAGHTLLLREFRVPSTAEGAVTIRVISEDPSELLHVAWLDANAVVGGRDDAQQVATTDATGRAQMDLDIGVVGFHCVAVYREPGQAATQADFTLEIYRTPADLVPYAPSNWHAPIVPRPFYANTPFVVSAPTELVGGTAQTWFAMSINNLGPLDATNVSTWLSIDGEPLFQRTWPVALGGIAEKYFWDQAQSIHGGRHTVVFTVDDPDSVHESFEENNHYGEQWVWRAETLSGYDPAIIRPAPPAPQGGQDRVTSGEALLPNLHGMRIDLQDDPAAPNWVAFAATPGDTSDVDVHVYPPSDDPKNAFQSMVLASSFGRGQTDYVLQCRLLDPARVWDIGVLRGGADGEQDYKAQVVHPASLGNNPLGTIDDVQWSEEDLMHLYSFTLNPGEYLISLDPSYGNIDWGLGLHAASAAWQDRGEVIEGGYSWRAGPGGAEVIQVVVGPSDPSQYCLAVFAADGTSMFEDGLYSLTITSAATAVDGNGTPALRTTLRGSRPNPFNPHTSVHFDLAVPGRVQLEVYNVRGERVRQLLDDRRGAGSHAAVWDGLDDQGRFVGSGVYLVRMRAGGLEEREKVTLVK